MLQEFAPREFFEALRDLGKLDWIEFVAEPGPECRTSFHFKHIEYKAKTKAYRVLFDRITKGTGTEISYWRAVSHLAAQGSKVFCPTLEQCEAMMHTEANIPLSEYQQPFPAMVISFPKEVVKKLHPTAPNTILLSHEQDSLTIAAKWRECEYVCMFSERPEFPTIESAITRRVNIRPEDAAEMDATEILQRMAINMAFLMTYFGITKPEYPNERIRRIVQKSQSEGKITFEPKYFRLKQEIKLIDKISSSEDHGGSHRSPHPHWRRGHFRHIVHGIGRKERKLAFIRPVFVLKHKFGGEMGDTEVTYGGS